MSNVKHSPDDLRTEVRKLGLHLHEGKIAGYTHYDDDFALGAIEISLGEYNAVFDNEVFPGVVYQTNQATILVSGDGVITAVDASSEADARNAIEEVAQTLEELGMILNEEQETQIPATEIPFSMDPPEVETLGYEDSSSDNQ